MSRMQVLMSKAGAVAHSMAAELTSASVGDRMPTAQELSERHGVGKGTVQAALALLEEAGAVEIRSRGKLGTFIAAIDHRLVWELAGSGSIPIAMPLPYTRRYEGLATGLHAAFEQLGLPCTLMFVRGSANRARAVRQGRADFAVMSGFAARADPELEIVRDFGPQTYVGAHGLVVAQGRDPDDPDLRLAVDPSSADQRELTALRFPGLPPERRVEVSYNQLGRHFADGLVDATVWNVDEVDAHIAAPITVHPLDGVDDTATTSAVVVARRGADPAPVAVREALAADVVMAASAEVVAGTRIPTY
ncbi:GntR family transcriptional regulator YhfZ [Streptomonospora nanhaiensis]|uniref:GntR family transcriptional regulator YhfZ n=1 Tax=Streptomonospora nanhaiensis TaxID=1323731 RepID=UPI001C99050D|nr:GntR family transcriptional regulator YhfZ [Streptomonospora nanhaiensis]MBX9390280.1 GntR family transcriptional regulator [Streptomonospora nanhaiensis]